jgi:hypothetical protein
LSAWQAFPTLFMSEQLAFEQTLGDRSAIDGDKRAAGTPAVLMHGSRDQFLPGT